MLFFYWNAMALLALLLIILMQLHHSSSHCHPDLWDLPGTPRLGHLEVEYTSVDGESEVMIVNTNVHENYSLQLIHTNGFMGYFPTNVCKFVTIVKIDLSDNHIKYIGNISCLINLKQLNLKGNALTRLSNTTLVQLKELRTLDVSENQIIEIEPYAVAGQSLNILWMNVSHNNLTSVDVTNIFMSGHFCFRDFTNNQATKLTNLLDIVFNTSVKYGPGDVIMRDNPLTVFPEFEKLGFPDISMLGALYDFGFDFRGSNFSCDCKMEPFLSLVKEVIERIWPAVYNVTCAHPPHLKGVVIKTFIRESNLSESNLDAFVCPIDAAGDCPVKCNCTLQPSRSRFIVDCQGLNLDKLPDRLPETSFLYVLNVCDNDIKVLDARNYLGKVSVLNACNNMLERVEDSAIYLMKNVTNISLANNRGLLKALPRTIQYLPGDSLDLQNLLLFCDCNTIWLSEWLQFRQVDSDTVFCMISNDRTIKAIDLKKALGDKCQVKDFTTLFLCICLAVILILIVISVIICYKFRYELLILLRRQDNSYHEFKYDVYISCDENNDHLCKWIMQILLPYLEYFEYRIYLPMRDSLPGIIAEEEVQNVLTKTRCFLVILSASFLCQQGRPRTEIEWKYAWNLYFKDRYRKLVMINFDHLLVSHVEPQQIKAFVRVGSVLDFGNRDGMHLDNVLRAIGLERKRVRGFKNARSLFNIQLLRSRNKIDFERQKSIIWKDLK